MKLTTLAILFAIIWQPAVSQESFSKGQVVFTGGIGVPHLTKTAIKLIVKTDAFKSTFNDVANVKVSGLNPICLKGEYGFKKYFGLGASFAVWNLKIDLTDRYNVLKAGQSLGSDSTDTYQFKITSTSFGLRPVIHIPLEDSQNDVYISMGFGYTKLALTVDFNSTDVNRSLPILDYKKKFSLPGSFYFSPLFGYRHYFSKAAGFYLELGWEKGSVIQAGFALRLGKVNSKVNSETEKKKSDK